MAPAEDAEPAPGPDGTAEALWAEIAALPDQLFAVIDGGRFDDCEDELADMGIPARSLFLDGADEARRRAGPWLAAPGNEATARRLAEIAAAEQCVVFWSAGCGENLLWQHLRTLNEAQVPRGGADAGDGLGAGDYEKVLFRHWDPNVLARVMPQMTPDQLARLFGPAKAVLMQADDYGGVLRHERGADFPPAPRGWLRFTPVQIRGIEEARLARSRVETADYLRRAAPEETAGMSDEVLHAAVVRIEAKGYELGLSSMKAHLLFAFMAVVGVAGAIGVAEFRAMTQESNVHPDDALELVYDEMIAAAEREAEEAG